MLAGPLLLQKTWLQNREELEELGFTSRHLDDLIHIQASHHGTVEWGANVPPASVEAVCVHTADLASARVATVTESMRVAQAVSPDLYTAPAGHKRLVPSTESPIRVRPLASVAPTPTPSSPNP
jgi:hypothetical protein